MNPFSTLGLSRKLPTFAAALLSLALAHPTLAAEEPDANAPKGASVTVLTAKKSCFADIVEVSGIVIPREETAVRPERQGLKVTEILAEAGDTVTAGQTLARLTIPDGGTQVVQAPVRGRTDVHGRAQAHRFQAAQNFNRSRVVAVTRSFAGHRLSFSHVVCFS